MIETTIQFKNDSIVVLRSNDVSVIDRILKLNSTHVDDVWIEDIPKNNAGYIIAEIPHSWIKILPPKRNGLMD